jgi:hypothetical protein
MRLLFLLIFLLFSGLASAQEDIITVYGSVFGDDGNSVPFPTVVVAGTSQRINSSESGNFTARLNRRDSLFIFFSGYRSLYVNFKDSLPNKEYVVTVTLRRMSFDLPEAIIRADKPLYEIKKDIQQLEKKNTNAYKKVGITSPLTMLWEKFSAKEKEKREVAELEYRQEIKDIVADLLRFYVKNDIVDYMEEEDIRLLAEEIIIPDTFLKSANEYDMAVFIKAQVKDYLEKN